ncbi:MAG: hypothetical protein ACKO63_03865 [Nodosilinea sp.]
MAFIPAVWITAIAVITVQNATPVTLRLLNLQSIAMPFGVVLAFGAAAGMVVTALLLVLLGGNPLKGRS